MKKDFSTCDTSSGADPELERLLTEAYDVPPLPRSLLKRLDQGIEAEWGRSPQLTPRRAQPLEAVWAGGKRLAAWPPLAAALAATIVVIVALNLEGRAYGWATMLEALAQCGIVEAHAGGETRWLSLSDQVLGERTARSWRLLDVRQRAILERSADETRIRRRPLPAAIAADPGQLAVKFLTGGNPSPIDAEDLSGLRVIEESWHSIQEEDRQRIVLRVSLSAGSNAPIELLLKLDPETGLPSECELPAASGKSTTLAIHYPTESVAIRREREFPARLAVVDVTDDGQVKVALSEVDRNPSPVQTIEAPAATPSSDPTSLAADAAHGATPMLGAPSKWRPVEVADRPANEIVDHLDDLLNGLWIQHDLTPTKPADDAELLRRAYLDLVGRTPSVTEVRRYLNDTSPRRYEALVDRLLDSPDHASHIATVWRTFLIPEGIDLARFGGVEAFDEWLAERLANGEAYDEIVRSLLLAEGRLSRSGPLLFYSALKLDPDQLASRTARVFLGMRLECAQCHDHPFEPWTQRDFWSFAAFFARISRPQADLEAVSALMQVRDVDHGEVMLPDTKTVVPPKFLNAPSPAEAPTEARREELARWLTGADNPYFARATANRVWGHLFGRGIVDPIDDFGAQHAARSPELLDALAGHLIQSKFCLRELFRAIAMSRAYRLSSCADTDDPERIEWFAQMEVKTLTAEQVYDCITVATLLDATVETGPAGLNIARFGNASRDEFVRQFRSPAGHRTEYLGGISQALTLMNGALIDSATGLSSSGLLKSLEAPLFTNRQRVEVLYLATLSRPPRDAEWEWLSDSIPNDASAAAAREGLADLLWALLNSAEFTLNH